MNELINFNSYPVNVALKALLKDKTTNQNIIFATDAYAENNSLINKKTQITESILKGFKPTVIQPRVAKSLQEQSQRTRSKAEVFTPSWICNKMNNYCDEEWFGRANLFNTEIEQDWEVNPNPISFENEKDWQKYVDSRRIEITCGEAPYIVSRYDVATGNIIPVKRRIGMLDRKLRIVNENTDNESDWFKWALRAFQSVYGYEFQGDNLLIARINLLTTFIDYMQFKWNKLPKDAELKKIVNVITWNFWQMDGLSGLVPYGKPTEKYQQISIFDSPLDDNSNDIECKIFDWRNNEEITFNSIKRGN